MSARLRATAAALLAAGLLAGCGTAGGSTVPPPPQNVGSVVDVGVPAAIQHIPLTKPDGSTTDLAAYRGKTVMIADYLTTCTDICPMITANAVALARALAADGQRNVALLEITVDPRRDIPARMRAYAKLYRPTPASWTQLRASPADTARLWKFLGVEYQREREDSPPSIDWWTHKPLKYDVSHSDDLIFLDPQGHERFVVNADPDLQGARLPASLDRSLTAQGRRNLSHPGPFNWTVRQGLDIFGWMLDRRLATPR